MLWPMRSRTSCALAMLILATCIICQVTEMFDQWDHTLQTGNDTEYTFVVLALCAGIAYSLKWFVPRTSLLDPQAETILYRRSSTRFFTLTHQSLMLAVAASPPATALRV